MWLVHIAAGEANTVKELARTLCLLDGFTEAHVRFDPTRSRMSPVLLIDNMLAREKLGFRPWWTLRDTLAQTLASHRRKRENWT